MAYVYQNLIIGDRLDVSPSGQVITTTKGDLISDNGTQTVRVPVGTNGQSLVANSATASGLEWQTLTPADIGLIAGTGLTLTGDTLNVGGSATIIANADNLTVNSSAIANQVLLSAGTVGTAATYGAVPLANAASVTGTLPIANGGTGSSSFTAGSRIIATNAGNTALVATAIDPATIVTLTGTETLTNKTLVTPIIDGSIDDINGNEIIILTPTVGAINEITVTNAATGTGPTIVASGDDANVDLNINAKGTGNVNISGLAFPNTDGTVGQVLSTNGAGGLQFIDVPVLDVDTITTTDATPTVISGLTIPTVAGTAYFVETKILAKETSPGTAVASFIIRSTFNNVAGTLTRIGLDLVYTPVGTTWTADVIATGTNIEILVTGAAGTTIIWRATVNIITV